MSYLSPSCVRFLAGYRLAFNRPGARANIVPVPVEGDAAQEDALSGLELAAAAGGGGGDARGAAGLTAAVAVGGSAVAESPDAAAVEGPAAAAAAAAPPAVHGVAHLLPLERAARLLLLQHESGWDGDAGMGQSGMGREA